MMERIREFDPVYAATRPPPPPVLTRQNANRLSSEDYMSDLSDSTDSMTDTDETG
jgi:hypothetical protein